MDECLEKNVLEELLGLLELEKIEENLFRGQSQDLGFGNVFGGQVLGQALSAAYRTVPAERTAHSIHAYFLRLGDAARPIIYNVDCIRDGKSFTTRRVVAIQKGRAIFNMSASFQIAEPGFEHQDPAPIVPGPEELEPDLVMARKYADQFPESIREKILCKKPLEIRSVDPINPFEPDIRKPVRYSWFKAIDSLPEDPAVHQYLLAYASDFHIVGTALYPHGHSFWEPGMQMASLDHAMWFHRDFRMDDWLLYVMKSPSACTARGLCQGQFYTRGGRLVASVAQEGLIRYHGPDQEGRSVPTA
jgi:acyl-CoA thioesterase II